MASYLTLSYWHAEAQLGVIPCIPFMFRAINYKSTLKELKILGQQQNPLVSKSHALGVSLYS